jgi:hypothetical protein
MKQVQQEFNEKRSFLHGLVHRIGDSVTGSIVKKSPTSDSVAMTEKVQVIAIPQDGQTYFLLRTPDAPVLEM